MDSDYNELDKFKTFELQQRYVCLVIHNFYLSVE